MVGSSIGNVEAADGDRTGRCPHGLLLVRLFGNERVGKHRLGFLMAILDDDDDNGLLQT